MDADLQQIKEAIDLIYYRNRQGLVTGVIGNSTFTTVLNAIQDSRDQNQAGFKVVTKAGHGFIIGDVVYHTGTDWAKAKANNVVSLGYFMVSAENGDDFTVQNIGLVTGLSGLTAGKMYYVSQATSGAMTDTKPSSGYANPIFYAISASSGFLMPFLADIDFDNINNKPGEVDETDADATKDKLVSNALAKGWEDHKDASSGNPHSVTKSEVGLGNVTNDAQIPLSQKGAANGVADLDGSSKVPVAQLPDAVVGALKYQGTWNANTNTPTITGGSGTLGYYYVVSVAGTTNIDGISDWEIGDWIVYNGTAWEKIDNSDKVSSVNSQTGAVTLDKTDIGLSNVTNDAQVKAAGDQTVNGIKTFGSFPITPSSAPTGDYQMANKKYVDDNGGGGGGSAEKWTALTVTTDFANTAPSTSTITMNADKTGSISPGMPVKFTIAGTGAGTYYAIVTAITSTLMTIQGYPLNTGSGELTALSYSDLPNATHQIDIQIPGNYAKAIDVDLAQEIFGLSDYWYKQKMHLVSVHYVHEFDDTGTITTKGTIDISLDGGTTDIWSSAKAISTSIQDSGVDIDANINYDDKLVIELTAVATGASPNLDAKNLKVSLIFVTE